MVTALKTSINILLVFLFAACTSVPDERMTPYVDFPETRELTARTLSLDSALFRYPYRVRVQDDKAVVLDLHGTEYFFHAFHYPGFHYLSSFGKRGRRDAFSRKSSMEWELFVDT